MNRLPLLALSVWMSGCMLSLDGLGGRSDCPGVSETCDGTDEDCDGTVDENTEVACGPTGTCAAGVQVCVNGGLDACAPRTDWPDEACDPAGDDEDCDGTVDEGCGCSPVSSTRACGEDTGECTTGEQTCGSDRMWGACSGTGPVPELCDGLDNDCDGTPDGQREQCRTARGICTDGFRTCTTGDWSECDGTSAMPAEICDAMMLDENCDGRPNEDCTCIAGATQPCGSGICAGLETCQSDGTYGTCVPTSPGTETCDGTDQDCNGVIDDGPADCAGETDCDVVRNGATVYLLCYQGSVDLRSDYDEARAYCAGVGYHLVTIDDVMENNFLARQMQTRDSGDWWIGYHDDNDDGVYEWDFGSSSYENWRSAPSDDKCATLDSAASDWEDKNCGDNRAFACEATLP